jgi:hypothetical protein
VQARYQERQGFDTETRLRLIEGDLDTHDQLMEKMVSKLERNNQLLVGILISITTACILMVVAMANGTV